MGGMPGYGSAYPSGYGGSGAYSSGYSDAGGMPSYPQNFYGQSSTGGYSANWGGGYAAQTPGYGGGYTASQTAGYGGSFTASPVAASMSSTPRPTSGSFVGYQPST